MERIAIMGQYDMESKKQIAKDLVGIFVSNNFPKL